MTVHFQRLAILARGQAAIRAIRTVREYNWVHDTHIRTVAFYTNPDRTSAYVREADESTLLGDPTFTDLAGQVRDRYFDRGRLLEVLETSGVDSVWPGWGVLAGDWEFVAACERMGHVYLGPPVAVLQRVRRRSDLRQVAGVVGLSVMPWSPPLATLASARKEARHYGYPLLLKSAGANGWRGTYPVNTPETLQLAFELAGREAVLFDGAALHIEPRKPYRLFEVPIAADENGTLWPLGVLDCTVSRRLHRVLVETPAWGLSDDEVKRLETAAVSLFQHLGYQGLGSVEFWFDPADRQFFLSELHPRLQPDHATTEMVTGLDLVNLQLHLARGGLLEGQRPVLAGHCVEVRWHAEDAITFAPAQGTIVQFRPPTGPGVRTDSGFGEQDALAPEFDTHVAVVVASGSNRTHALARLVRALSEASLLLTGGGTNKGFLLWLLQHPEVRGAKVGALWLDHLVLQGAHAQPRYSQIAIIQAALEQYNEELHLKRARFLESAVRLRPQIVEGSSHTAELWYQGRVYRVLVMQMAPGRYRVLLGGQYTDVRIEPLGDFAQWLLMGNRRFRIVSIVEGLRHRVEVEGFLHQVDRLGGKTINAPSPAMVVKALVRPGDSVMVGDPVIVLEAMKIETTLVSDMSGRVREVLVTPNTQVGTGTGLVRIDSDDRPDAIVEANVPPADTPCDTPEALFDFLHHFLLGYDVGPATAQRQIDEWLSRPVSPAGQEQDAALLEVFSDLIRLFRRRSPEDAGPGPLEHFYAYLRHLDGQGANTPPTMHLYLTAALRHYDIKSLQPGERLETALYRIFQSRSSVESQIRLVLGILERWVRPGLKPESVARQADLRALLERLSLSAQGQFQPISYLARELCFQLFEDARLEQYRYARYRRLEGALTALVVATAESERKVALRKLLASPHPLLRLLNHGTPHDPNVVEVLLRSYYKRCHIEGLRVTVQNRVAVAQADLVQDGRLWSLTAVSGEWSDLAAASRLGRALHPVLPLGRAWVLDLYLHCAEALQSADQAAEAVLAFLPGIDWSPPPDRIAVALAGRFRTADILHFTFRPASCRFREDATARGLHPAAAQRMQLRTRLSEFHQEWLPSDEDVYLCHAQACSNPKDVRLIAVAELEDAEAQRDAEGRLVVPDLDRMVAEVTAAVRKVRQRQRPDKADWLNWILLYLWPDLQLTLQDVRELARRLAPADGLKAMICLRCVGHSADGDAPQPWDVLISHAEEAGVSVAVTPASDDPLAPLDEYGHKVLRLQQRGTISPYEVIRMLTHCGEDLLQPGDFQEYDLSPDGQLVAVERPPGRNEANLVVGVVTNYTARYREGMKRVILVGDPSRAMGAVAEPECRRVLTALDLAHVLGAPVEWFALSAGARIAMDSGVENMDWIARVLARIIMFTQAGGEINVVVDGINVGAQPYWNAEATMLLHTRGVLIMTPRGAMVLTGKKALDYSGSVSGDDNADIGGYDRIMGPNGQAQYWARNLHDACTLLLRHYAHAYVFPGERFPRRAPCLDPIDRDVQEYPYQDSGNGFTRLGDIFSEEKNPGRKTPFEIRQVMRAVIDADSPPLERWSDMAKAGTAVVWDAHLGGYPVCLLGFESCPVPRLGFIPIDGPSQWTSGTLFPQSSRKVARAINSVGGSRPVVVLANLSGFDGSPESMRRWQLEYGAEIGRAVVNFRGPIVFCVISRYHGGAYVVFSRVLNDNLQVSAVEGSFASVIGGAPAAAVVFAGEVDRRTRSDPRVLELQAAIAQAKGAEIAPLRAQWLDVTRRIQAEMLGQVADEFDRVHTVERALKVGAIDCLVPPARLRPHLVEAVERGLRRALEERQGAVRPAGGREDERPRST